MRKVLIAAALLFGAAILSGSPAKAQAMLGCQCVSLAQPPACTATVLECTFQRGGVCVAPCSYEPPKAAKKKHRRHHAKKKAK